MKSQIKEEQEYNFAIGQQKKKKKIFPTCCYSFDTDVVYLSLTGSSFCILWYFMVFYEKSDTGWFYIF
jgi:hypothetical protein